MKKILSIATLFLGMLLTFAQAPEKMSYQAVIRNATGQLLANQSVAVKVSVLQTSATGTVVYSERLTGTTNVNGLLSMEIGGGTIISGTFSTINWSSGNYYLKTETDPAGGTNYSIAGTSQLLSVPYAMYAKSSGSGGFTLPYAGVSSTDNVIPFKITNSSGTLNQAALFENTNATNSAPAVSGINNSTGSFGVGVFGRANTNTNGNVSSGVYGYVQGTGTAGAGVFGQSQNATGVYGSTSNGYGVEGYANGTGTAGSFRTNGTGSASALSTYGSIQLGNINAAAGKVLTATDVTGNATWQNLPANTNTNTGFNARLFNDFALTSVGTFQKISFDRVVFNDGSNFSSSSYEYTIPSSGVYQFNVNISFTAAQISSLEGMIAIRLKSSSSTTALSQTYIPVYAGAKTASTGNISSTEKLVAGEKITIEIYKSINETVTVSSISNLSGHKVY